MPTIPFTLDAIAGLALGALFAFVCARRPSRGILLYVALAWLPILQVATLSGTETSVGLMQAEWLASILIVAWLLHHPPGHLPLVEKTPFNAPLLALIPLSCLSLLSGSIGLDPTVDGSHVRVSVSIGQILLFVWPIGVYLVVANTLPTTESLRKVVRILIALAIPAVALPILPAAVARHFEWSVYFALTVSPLCFAASLDPGLSPPRRVGLVALSLAPAVYGIQTGKALWYVVPFVGLTVVAALRARRLLVAALPLAAGAYLLFYVPATGSWLPQPVQPLVAQEEAQASIGGRAGRAALASDAVGIWTRYPLLGVGPGNNYPYMIRYSVLATPHGQYVNILLELGIAGLACYLAFVAGALRMGLGLLRSVRSPFHEVLVLGWLGLFAGLVGVGGLAGDFTLHSIRNDGLLAFSRYFPQWVMLGLVVAAKRIEGR